MNSTSPSENISNSSTLREKQSDTRYLQVDSHTMKDLEVFESETGGMSLFDLCNFTRTEGGAKELKRRMAHPWSNDKHIKQTQETISYVISKSEAFAKLPSYITRSVERYQREVVMLVTQVNFIEFGMAAFSLWANNDRHYHNILRGVQYNCGLIRAARRFANQQELSSPVGEVAQLLEEIREILNRPKLAEVPDKEIGSSWPWKVLRLDQNFRLHEKGAVFRLLELIYEIDALVSMAIATNRHGYVMPKVIDGPPAVEASGMIHPFVDDAIANPVTLNQEKRLLFLTGPNMAGKTTYLRAFSTSLYLGHLGMGVPADSFSFSPTQTLFSSISLSDDLRAGISYFRAEALRVKAVATAIAQGMSVVAIMDEPFKGTNVKDALDASQAILERFAGKQNCLFMFSSHLIELKERLANDARIDCCHFEADESDGRLRFDFCLRPGVSSQRLGLRVLTEEGVFGLLDADENNSA